VAYITAEPTSATVAQVRSEYCTMASTRRGASAAVVSSWSSQIEVTAANQHHFRPFAVHKYLPCAASCLGRWHFASSSLSEAAKSAAADLTEPEMTTGSP
jgi:hypothetical protein